MNKYVFRILILFVFVLFNCTEDEAIPTEEASTESSVSFPNGITLKSLTKEEYPHKEQISQKIEGVLNPKPVLNPIQGNSISSQNENDNNLLNGLTVLENYAKYIEYPNGFHSYTFDVVRETPNGKFENLLLLSAENDQYNAFLVQYDITEEERQRLTNGEYIDLEGKVNAYLLSEEQQGQISPLQSNTADIGNPCGGGIIIVYNIGGGFLAVACADITFYHNDSSGGGSYGIWTSPSGEEYYVYVDDGTYGNGGGSFGDNPFAIAPISAFDEAVEDLEDCMGNGLFSPQLTDEQIDFLNDDVELVEEMLGECKQNGGTFEEILKETLINQINQCMMGTDFSSLLTPEQQTWLNAQENSQFLSDLQIEICDNGNDDFWEAVYLITNPCEKIQEQYSNTNFRVKILRIYQLGMQQTDLTEHGYAQLGSGWSPLITGDQNSGELNGASDYYNYIYGMFGIIHSHPGYGWNDGVILSIGDLIVFLKTLKRACQHPTYYPNPSNFYLAAVSGNTYMLRFNGNDACAINNINGGVFDSEFEKELEVKRDNYTKGRFFMDGGENSRSKYSFTKLIDDVFNGAGVELYEIEGSPAENSTPKKLTPNEDGININKQPCN